MSAAILERPLMVRRWPASWGRSRYRSLSLTACVIAAKSGGRSSLISVRMRPVPFPRCRHNVAQVGKPRLPAQVALDLAGGGHQARGIAGASWLLEGRDGVASDLAGGLD